MIQNCFIYYFLQTFDFPDTGYVYLILAFFALIAWLKNSKKTEDRKQIIREQVEVLQKAYEELTCLIEKKESLERIAEVIKQKYKVPEVITLRYLSLIVKATITEGIYPLLSQEDNTQLVQRLYLLNEFSRQYNLRITDNRGSILDLDETKNVFYLQERVTSKMLRQNTKDRYQLGIFILSTHYLIFIKFKRLSEIFEGEDMQELLSKVTEEIPLLNFGVLTCYLLNSFEKILDQPKTLFTEDAKNKLIDAYNHNECIFIGYKDIKAIFYPNLMNRLFLPKLRILTKDNMVYSFFSGGKEDPPFFDIAFKTLTDLCLISGNLILPESSQKTRNWISFYTSP